MGAPRHAIGARPARAHRIGQHATPVREVDRHFIVPQQPR